jgi:hypothetical protein
MKTVVVIFVLALAAGSAFAVEKPISGLPLPSPARDGKTVPESPPVARAREGADTLGSDEEAGQKTEIERQEIKKEMARVGQKEVPGQKRWEREKSPRVAMLSSMLVPGLGQLYNGRRLKTMIAVGVFTYYLGTSWFEQKKSQEHLVARDALRPGSIDWRNQDILYQFHKENAVTYLWWSGAAWLITVLDAFVDAHLYDVRAVTPAVVRGTGDTKYIALSVGF